MFLNAALRYWLLVFPRTAFELRRLRRRARQIPDTALRRLALEALAKRANIEGAAAFATFVPWRRRGRVLRATVAFQAAYNHADLLAEQPSADPVAVARLHAALPAALSTSDAGCERYPVDFGSDDGAYLAELAQRCGTALRELPSYAAVQAAAERGAGRIAAFQCLSLGEVGELERWVLGADGARGLEWWELAAATGSSLVVHALIALAAEPKVSAAQVAAVEETYFPWAGALHSLLDSLVDEQEDRATGQLSLIGCYPSRGEAEVGMARLTGEALARARALPGGRRHALIVTAMACSYIAAQEISSCGQAVALRVRGVLGLRIWLILLIFKIRALAARALCALRGACAWSRVRALSSAREHERGADAGVA